MSGLAPARVHELAVAVWGRQTCQINPADWPRVLAALMSNAAATTGKGATSEHNHGRASLRPMLDEAVAALVAAFSADAPPDDPAMTVWVCFPKLDQQHRSELAKLLMAERA